MLFTPSRYVPVNVFVRWESPDTSFIIIHCLPKAEVPVVQKCTGLLLMNNLEPQVGN